ncbi:asparagine synthase-related protein [Kutzneria kofuensis]|uniref:Asparagine synthase (Glutamine-hydrolyzing) n=1 Tax=Kutzneria kofuensis TaxID=103725 RepID=A0A7W9KCV9_9PSEU|nr:asparagine synthase C-terminal domain-containing protein [Kutzneria kofuensis]MBB5889848.1 asparagine synthase (glutamine-hydrolyzing) [Kutzneria kofuensis]
MGATRDVRPDRRRPATRAGAAWFVVLPDTERATAAEAAAPTPATRIDHCSGRPWLVGRWPDGEFLLAEAGTTRLAVLGHCPVGGAALAQWASRIRDVADVDAVAASLPGSFHLIASVNGRSRVQGSVSGLRRVFHAVVDGVTVATDRGDVLARMTGAAVDRRWLAARLLVPNAPYPLADAALWQGVFAVPGDSYLCVSDTGAGEVVRWWEPPEPNLGLRSGASAVRLALETAVWGRAYTEPTLSCDLAGGIDSASICYLAAGSGRQLTVLIAAGDNGSPAVERAARGLPDVRRLAVSPWEVRPPYADVAGPGPGWDEPLTGIENRANMLATARKLAVAGCRAHLTDSGASEVLQGGSAYLCDLALTRPFLALSRARGHRGAQRWSRRSVAQIWTDRRDYGDWLVDMGGALTAGLPAGDNAPTGWGSAFRLPAWATAEAADAVRELIAEVAADVRPLARTRGRHDALWAVRQVAYRVRGLAALVASAGVALAAPFLDDRVVEACLAVRPHERTGPGRDRALLVEAMRGVVPGATVRRPIEPALSAPEPAPPDRARSDLLALCEDSALARLGLVDADRLRSACDRMPESEPERVALSRTFGCERWLRDLAEADPGYADLAEADPSEVDLAEVGLDGVADAIEPSEAKE